MSRQSYSIPPVDTRADRQNSPDAYCRDKVRASHSSFAISFRLLPAEKRRAITALYALCREVDDVVDEANDIDTARQQLEAWRREIDALYEGRPSHPVTRALEPALRHYTIDRADMLELVAGMEMDLEKHRYDNFAELERYCYRAASVVGLMAAAIFGYQDKRTRDYAVALGMALQLTNILRDVAEDCGRDRIYLPQAELARFGVDETMLCGDTLTPQIRELFRFQAERALGYYDRALAALPKGDRRQQLSGLVMAAIYRATLRRIIDRDYPVLDGRISLTRREKLWLTLRTLWRELRR